MFFHVDRHMHYSQISYLSQRRLSPRSGFRHSSQSWSSLLPTNFLCVFVLLFTGLFGLFTIIWVVWWVLCLFVVTDQCSPHNSLLLFYHIKTNSQLTSNKAPAIEAESHSPFSQAEGCMGSATVRFPRFSRAWMLFLHNFCEVLLLLFLVLYGICLQPS